MSHRKLKALQVESTKLATGNHSGRTPQVMDGGAELVDKLRSLETELAEASEAIALEDLCSQINEAKARAQHEAAE